MRDEGGIPLLVVELTAEVQTLQEVDDRDVVGVESAKSESA